MRFLIAILVLSSSAFAQESDLSFPQGSRTLKQDGQIFTIQLVLGEPMRFFVLGKEEAKLDLAEIKMTVRRLEPYPGKILSLDFKDGYFVTAKTDALEGATKIEVTTQAKSKSDKVRFKIENQKP